MIGHFVGLSYWFYTYRYCPSLGEHYIMEGPFSFKESKSNVQLVFNDKVQASYPIDWQELRKSIGRTAEQVIQYLEAKNYNHKDLNELKDKYSLKNDWLS